MRSKTKILISLAHARLLNNTGSTRTSHNTREISKSTFSFFTLGEKQERITECAYRANPSGKKYEKKIDFFLFFSYFRTKKKKKQVRLLQLRELARLILKQCLIIIHNYFNKSRRIIRNRRKRPSLSGGRDGAERNAKRVETRLLTATVTKSLNVYWDG